MEANAPSGVKGNFDLSKPTMWLFGNEAQGLNVEEKAAATMRVAVPVYGSAESLNVGYGCCCVSVCFGDGSARRFPLGFLGWAVRGCVQRRAAFAS